MCCFVKRIVLLKLLLIGTSYAQEVARPTGTFEIIIGISAHNGETTAKDMKLKLKDSPVLTFRGYCENQQCILLTAQRAEFASPQAVADYLKTIYADGVLGFKDYPVSEFYRQCSFPDEAEYQYFKQTYGR
jgi:hypothetical protein